MIFKQFRFEPLHQASYLEAVICGDEVRSSLVASILARLGHRLTLVLGGMVGRIKRAYPQEKGGA